MAEIRYTLRDLHGICELEDLLRRIAAEKNPEWTPLADGLQAKVDAVSRQLFGLTEADTDDPPSSFRPDILDQFERWAVWVHEFNGTPSAPVELEGLGWDVNNAAGEELLCAEYFS